MNVLHINTHYIGGGASRAMRRLGNQLEINGHQSRFLIGRPDQKHYPQVNYLGDYILNYATKWDGLLSRIGNQLEGLWGINPWARRPTLRLPETDVYQWADVIDLRNLFGDYFNMWVLPELSAKKPVFWRLPDMWALTGHCAYPYDCQRWVTGCHDCPLLTEEGRRIVEPPPTKWDGTRRVWHAKRDIYLKSKLHIIVTTRWMKKNVERGILGNALSISVISNGVDLQIYKPYVQERVRKDLGLPIDKKIFIFSAARLGSFRKGYSYAVDAVKMMQHIPDPPLLITMGSSKGVTPEEKDYVRHIGFVENAEKQAKLFAAADLFLCTTLADAQPQTALESIACGTPVVAFNIGPMPDIVGKNHGLITEDITPEALRDALEIAFKSPGLILEMGRKCRQTAEREYDIEKQTDQYIKLYEDTISQYPTSY